MSAPGGLAVHRLGPEEWETLRALRLAMLLDAPGAYGSSYAREIAFDEEAWRSRTASPTFVVRDGELPLGMATLVGRQGRAPEITGMWVAGHARGGGAADALVRACLDQAIAQGADAVELHVMGDNPRARQVYERHGFALTGDLGDAPGCLQMALHQPR